MKNLNYFLLISFILLFAACSKYEYDLNEYNQYYNYSRTNDYSKLGNLNFSIITKNKISVNDFSGIIKPPLYFEDENFILSTGNSKIIFLAKDSILWSYNLDSINSLSNLVATKNKRIFFVGTDGYLYVLDKFGKLINKTFINLDSSKYLLVSEPLAFENQIYIGTDDGYLFKIDINGNIINQKKFNLSINSVFSCDGKNKLFVGLTNNEYNKTDTLLILDFQLNIIKKIALEGLRIIAPIVFKNNNIYLAGSKRDLDGIASDIICINNNFEIIWRNSIPLICTQLSIDDKNIYAAGISSGIGENLTGFFAYDNNGKEIWKNYMDIKIVSPLILGKKYLIFTATDENGAAAFALNKNKGTLTKRHFLTDETPLYLIPSVSYNKDIYLFGSQILLNLKITQTSLDKILPY